MSSRRSRSGGTCRGKTCKPVIQVRAELILFHHRLEIAICGGDEADVGPDGAIASDPLEFLVLDGAQQLRLEFERHFPDLIEKQASPDAPARIVRSSARIAPVKEPFSWPKSSLSSRLAGIAAQFTFTKLPFLRFAQLMNGPGDEFFARSGFAQNEDG